MFVNINIKLLIVVTIFYSSVIPAPDGVGNETALKSKLYLNKKCV